MLFFISDTNHVLLIPISFPYKFLFGEGYGYPLLLVIKLLFDCTLMNSKSISTSHCLNCLFKQEVNVLVSSRMNSLGGELSLLHASSGSCH